MRGSPDTEPSQSRNDSETSFDESNESAALVESVSMLVMVPMNENVDKNNDIALGSASSDSFNQLDDSNDRTRLLQQTSV